MVWQDKDKTQHTLASLCCPQYHVRRPEGAADGSWKQSQRWPHTSGLLLCQQTNIFVHILKFWCLPLLCCRDSTAAFKLAQRTTGQNAAQADWDMPQEGRGKTLSQGGHSNEQYYLYRAIGPERKALNGL